MAWVTATGQVKLQLNTHAHEDAPRLYVAPATPRDPGAELRELQAAALALEAKVLSHGRWNH